MAHVRRSSRRGEGGCHARTPLIASTLLAALASCTSTPEAPAPRPPNVVLIFMDNVGYGDLGCYGNSAVLTPVIDRLATEGVRCTDFYVASSSCTPSRGALLTGRHPLRNGLAHQLAAEENRSGVGLPHRETILPRYLKPRGYATGCFGKWNIGFAPGSRPTERGFDEFLGFASGNINYYTHVYHGRKDFYRGVEPVDVEGYSTDLFADAACDFIARHAAGPFFVYLPFNAAHFLARQNMAPGEPPVWQVPGPVLERYGWKGDDADPKRRYLGVLTALDAGIGRVLKQIDDLGLRENTLVIVLSDNGAFMSPGSGLGVASNLPFRGGGTEAYEGGVRVPCLVRWPGRLPAGAVCREPLSELDLLPTILRVAGVQLPRDRVLDGKDALPTFAEKAPSPHERLFFQFGDAAGLREGTLKLVRPDAVRPAELYDLAADPGETRDLAAERPETAARLAAALDRWRVDAGNAR